VIHSEDPSSSPLFPAEFRAIVVAELTAAGLTVIDWETNGVNVRPVAGGDGQYIGLANLHRRARAVNPTEWPAMVREFIERSSRSKLQSIPTDLNTVSDRLRPRLGQPFDRRQAHPWGIPLPGTGLEITIVIDFPQTMAFVTPEMLTASRKKGEDLLDVALENLRTATPPDYFERASDQLDIYIGHTGDGYDAARALLVEELMPDSPAGFWVAIPSREELAVWPFPALGRVHVLKMFADENFREHAYPVSDEVFWVWHGTWYRFGIALKDDDLVIDAPEPFGEALQELQGDAPPDAPEPPPTGEPGV
jgi:hypothetical protein